MSVSVCKSDMDVKQRENGRELFKCQTRCSFVTLGTDQLLLETLNVSRQYCVGVRT